MFYLFSLPCTANKASVRLRSCASIALIVALCSHSLSSLVCILPFLICCCCRCRCFCCLRRRCRSNRNSWFAAHISSSAEQTENKSKFISSTKIPWILNRMLTLNSALQICQSNTFDKMRYKTIFTSTKYSTTIRHNKLSILNLFGALFYSIANFVGAFCFRLHIDICLRCNTLRSRVLTKIASRYWWQFPSMMLLFCRYYFPFSSLLCCCFVIQSPWNQHHPVRK